MTTAKREQLGLINPREAERRRKQVLRRAWRKTACLKRIPMAVFEYTPKHHFCTTPGKTS